MAHFLTVVTLDLASVTRRLVRAMFLLLLLVGLPGLSCVYSGGRGGAFSTLSVSASVLLLFLLAGLLGGLSLMLRSRCFVLLGFGPGLLRSRVSYRVALGASPSGVGSVAAQTSLVHLFDVGGGLQACLGLGIDRFLYDLGPTV